MHMHIYLYIYIYIYTYIYTYIYMHICIGVTFCMTLIHMCDMTRLYVARRSIERGGRLGSRPKKMYGERLGDGVEYHLMSPTPHR